MCKSQQQKPDLTAAFEGLTAVNSCSVSVPLNATKTKAKKNQLHHFPNLLLSRNTVIKETSESLQSNKSEGKYRIKFIL